MRFDVRRWVAAAAVATVSFGYLRADDRVEYRDPKNRALTAVAVGTILDENFATLKLRLAAGGKEVVVPVADLVKVTYELGAAKLDYTATAAAEDKQDYAKALEGYAKMQPKVAANERAKRFVEYKIATTQAAMAADRPDAVPAAIEALKKFTAANTGTWQTANAARALIGLQLKVKDAAGALATADAWAALDKLPKEAKQDAELARIDVLLQSGRVSDALAKADNLARGLPAGDPLKARLELYALAGPAFDKADKSAEVAKKVDDLIAKSADANFKSAAYNLVGLCQQAKGQPREAMWAYLWVDVVYNQDRAEHVRALESLIRLFEETEGMKDPEKAKLFRDKLARLRQ